DYSETEYRCRTTYPDRTESNCTERVETCSSTRDGVTETRQCTRRDCDVDQGDPVEVCDNETKNFTWRGCVGSREPPYNVRDENYAARPVPGVLNIDCATEISALTASKSSVISAINAMAVQGSQTYIPGGLVWGHRVLSDLEPFSEGVPYSNIDDDGAVKALVLMTDGESTRSKTPSEPFHWKTTRDDADLLTEQLCTEIKSANIQLYTIAFEVTDTATRNLLENCATSPDHYFNATDATALSQSFSTIAVSLTELSLTR
ncbi:MAG: VWA domain-containing protein, partial [Pseudomonadota bacterium]